MSSLNRFKRYKQSAANALWIASSRGSEEINRRSSTADGFIAQRDIRQPYKSDIHLKKKKNHTVVLLHALHSLSKRGLTTVWSLSLSFFLCMPHFRRKSKWIFWDGNQDRSTTSLPSFPPLSSSPSSSIVHFEENVPVPYTTPVPSSLHGVSIIIAVFHVIASKRKIVIQFVWSGRNRATRPSEWSHRGFAGAWPFNHHKFRGETANRPLSYRPLCSSDPWDRFQRASHHDGPILGATEVSLWLVGHSSASCASIRKGKKRWRIFGFISSYVSIFCDDYFFLFFYFFIRFVFLPFHYCLISISYVIFYVLSLSARLNEIN